MIKASGDLFFAFLFVYLIMLKIWRIEVLDDIARLSVNINLSKKGEKGKTMCYEQIQMKKTFSIDLKSLYEYIGDGHTCYGYWIEHDEHEEYYDLRDSIALYACDGEVCKIIDIRKNYVALVCIGDNYSSFKFILTKKEFYFACHEHFNE